MHSSVDAIFSFVKLSVNAEQSWAEISFAKFPQPFFCFYFFLYFVHSLGISLFKCIQGAQPLLKIQ